MLEKSGHDDLVRLLQQGVKLRIPLPSELMQDGRRELNLYTSIPGWFFVSTYQKSSDQSHLFGYQVGQQELHPILRFKPGRILGVSGIRSDLLFVQTSKAIELHRLFAETETIHNTIYSETLQSEYGDPLFAPLILPSKVSDGDFRLFNIVQGESNQLRPVLARISAYPKTHQPIDLTYGSSVGAVDEILDLNLTSEAVISFAKVDGKSVILRHDLGQPLATADCIPISSDIEIRPGRIMYHNGFERFFCITRTGRLVKFEADACSQLDYEPMIELDLTGYTISHGPRVNLCLQKPGSSLIIYQPGTGKRVSLTESRAQISCYLRVGRPVVWYDTIALLADPQRPHVIAWKHSFSSTRIHVHEEKQILSDDGQSTIGPVFSCGCLAWLDLEPADQSPAALVVCCPTEFGDR